MVFDLTFCYSTVLDWIDCIMDKQSFYYLLTKTCLCSGIAVSMVMKYADNIVKVGMTFYILSGCASALFALDGFINLVLSIIRLEIILEYLCCEHNV